MKCHGAAGRSLVIQFVKRREPISRSQVCAWLAEMPERPFAAEFSFEEVVGRLVDEGTLSEDAVGLRVTALGELTLQALNRKLMQAAAASIIRDLTAASATKSIAVPAGPDKSSDEKT